MANNFRIANAAADAAAGDGSSVGLGGFIGSGAKIKCYVGTQNTDPETAPAGTLLSSNAVTGSFSSASGDGVIDTATIANAAAGASGTAGSFWFTKANDTTPVADGTVGTSGCDLNFDNNIFVSGGTVAISTMAITIPPH